MGYFYSIVDDYTQMKNVYIEAIKLEPDNFEFHYNIGYAYIKLINYKEAIVSFEKAIKLKANLFGAYFYRGDLLNRIFNETNLALINYETANNIFPNNGNVINKIASCLYNLNKFTDALRWCNKGILKDKSNYELHNNKGLCLNKLNLNKEALASFLEALRLNPLNDICLSNISFTYYHLNQLKESFSYMNDAIRLNPNEAKYYYYKGILLSKLRSYEQGIECLDKSIELDQNLIKAYYAKNYSLIILNKYKEAAEWSLKSFQKFPNNLDFYKSSLHSLLLNYENVTRNLDLNDPNEDWFTRIKNLNE